MSFVLHGEPTYRFGFSEAADAAAIADAVGVKPETLDISGEPEFTAAGKNHEGMTEAFVVGDDKYTFTLKGRIVNLALFSATGATFDYDGRHYIVTGRKRTISNVDFEMGEVTGEAFALITS